MRKIIKSCAVILAAALLFATLPLPGATAEEDGPVLVVEFGSKENDGSYPVNVRFENAWGINAATINLTFDPFQIETETGDYENVDDHISLVYRILDDMAIFEFECFDDDGFTDDENLELGSLPFKLGDEALSADYIEITATFECFVCDGVEYSGEQRAAMTTVARLGIHNYGEPDYQFSSDNACCTAFMVCSDGDCGNHIQSETVDTRREVRGDPDCNSGGRVWYVAEFTKYGFERQEIPVTVDVIGHTAGEPEIDPESVVPATKIQDGHHDVVTYCVRCHTELSRETVTDVYIPTEPVFATRNLVLSGSIGLSFNMALPAIDGVDYSTSYMTFSIPHGTVNERVDYSESQTKSSGNRAFVAYVGSIQMAEPVTATFHYFENGTEKTVTDVYSVADYFEAFDAIADQFDEGTQALVRALADYGHYVQPFLAEARGWELGRDYATLEKCYHEGDYEFRVAEGAVAGERVTIVGSIASGISVTYSLTLDSDTVINVYIRPSELLTGDFEASIDGGERFACEKDSQGRLVVRIKDVAAHDLGQTHVIGLFTKGGTVAIMLSALSYVKAALEYYNDTNDPDLTARNALAAIVAYYEAADAYISSR